MEWSLVGWNGLSQQWWWWWCVSVCFGLFCILHSFAPHWQFMNMTTATVHGQRLNVVVFSVQCSLFVVQCSVFCILCSLFCECVRACLYIHLWEHMSTFQEHMYYVRTHTNTHSCNQPTQTHMQSVDIISAPLCACAAVTWAGQMGGGWVQLINCLCAICATAIKTLTRKYAPYLYLYHHNYLCKLYTAKRKYFCYFATALYLSTCNVFYKITTSY